MIEGLRRDVRNRSVFCKKKKDTTYWDSVKEEIESHVGDQRDVGIPGNISNPEVKRVNADGTWRATSWESRSLPTWLFFVNIPPRTPCENSSNYFWNTPDIIYILRYIKNMDHHFFTDWLNRKSILRITAFHFQSDSTGIIMTTQEMNHCTTGWSKSSVEKVYRQWES